MFDFVGGITAPFSLLILGSVLAGMHAKEVFAQPKMWIFSAIRLFLLPALLLVILRQMNLDQVALGVAVIEMAMPVAVNGVMLCMEYDGDVDMMAQSIFVTTILSMVTIPVVAMFL
jgi:predicted permease